LDLATREISMKVRNINGTSDNSCKCASWLDHWKKFGGQAVPQYCPESTCTKKPEHGAHVQKDGSSDQSWYIIPLCADHNGQKGATLVVSDSTKLVSANVKETCGK
jgi:hypothetical protein